MPPRSKADPKKLAAAVRVVLDGALSQRAACKRYGVPKTTLARAVAKAREEGDEGGPDQGEASGPDRTRAEQMPTHGERWQQVAALARQDARLDGPQLQAAAMLVAAHPHDEVAAACGTSSRTLSRWKNDPVFQAVQSDLRAACHLQAREVLARGAEQAVRGMSAAAELFERLNRKALDLLNEHEAGGDVSLAEVQIAMKAAVEASRLIPAGRALMDAGGFPKTERVEVNDTTERDAGGLRDDARDGAASLKLLVGGRAEKV